MTRLPRLLVVGCLVLVAEAPRAASAGPRASLAADPDEEIARRHFSLGAAHYAEGRYDEALREFRAARELRPLAALDYNIARCLDRLERPHEAIEAYEAYMTRAGADGGQQDARERVAVLKARLERRQAAAAAPAARERRMIPLAAPIVIDAVAVAALSTGLGLYFSVGGDYDRCRDQAAAGTYCTDDALAGFKKRDQAGVGLMIAGGTLLALDVGLLIASIKLRRPVRP